MFILGENCYNCSVCSRKFPTKVSLSRHETIHAEVKPFKCSHCDRGFSQVSKYIEIKIFLPRPFEISINQKFLNLIFLFLLFKKIIYT